MSRLEAWLAPRADPHMLRHTASLLTYEGAERWKRSFPGLVNMCTDLVLGDGQGARVVLPRRSAISI